MPYGGTSFEELAKESETTNCSYNSVSFGPGATVQRTEDIENRAEVLTDSFTNGSEMFGVQVNFDSNGNPRISYLVLTSVTRRVV